MGVVYNVSALLCWRDLGVEMAALEEDSPEAQGSQDLEDGDFMMKKLILELACYYCQHNIIRSEYFDQEAFCLQQLLLAVPRFVL